MDLNPDLNSEERFVQLFAANENHLRAFIRSTGLDWNAVDEVVQTVSLVMWRKWDEFDPSTEFMRWGRVIARFEVLKYRRKMARDRHVFREDVMELLAETVEEHSNILSNENYREALAQCLGHLPQKSKELISAAYQDGQTIRDLAAQIGKSDTALYKALDRIRKKLQECIHKRVELGEAGA